jgi:SET domain-containing protein
MKKKRREHRRKKESTAPHPPPLHPAHSPHELNPRSIPIRGGRVVLSLSKVFKEVELCALIGASEGACDIC